jgi:hypothetical protein
VRDVTCREDQARANARNAPQELAALRNTVLTVLRRLGFNPVEGFEHFAEHRQQAINVVWGRRTEWPCDERDQLNALIQKGKAPVRQVLKVRILLKAGKRTGCTVPRLRPRSRAGGLSMISLAAPF